MRKILFFVLFINLNISYAEINNSTRYDVYANIKETRKLNVGARIDGTPFSYKAPSGGFDGFSIDIVKELHKKLESDLNIKIKLNFIPVTAEDRIFKIQNHQIDLECGLTTPTWDRENDVDFSIPFFIDYVKLFTINKNINQSKIGVSRGSTMKLILSRAYPNMNIVEIADMNSGLEQLRKGEIDGLINIYILLKALIKNTKFEQSVIFIPDNSGFSESNISCIIPEDNSDWKDFINKSISELLIGVNEFRGKYFEIYEKWFGKSGYIYHPMDMNTSKRLSPTMWFY